MAQRILKNNTASPVTISDVGQTVPASGQLVINPVDYGVFEGSSNVITYIGNGTLTVNDGTFDLSITDGTRLIQGGFYLPLSDGDDPTVKAKVTSGLTPTSLNKRVYSESVVAGLESTTLRRVNVVTRTDSKIALCVDSATIPAGAIGPVPAISPTFKYEDMNASVGGVARDTAILTTFTNLYSVLGSGLFFGFLVTLETFADWTIRFTIDGNQNFFGTAGVPMTDITGGNLYNYADAGPLVLGLRRDSNTLFFQLDYPVAYATSIVIQGKTAGSKRFRAGFAIRS